MKNFKTLTPLKNLPLPMSGALSFLDLAGLGDDRWV